MQTNLSNTMIGSWFQIGTLANLINSVRNKTDVQHDTNKEEPSEQFLAMNDFEKVATGRGTACCVDIDFAPNVTFKVGISHITTPARGYLSRFHAFDANSPTSLVAMSGQFCFGRMKKETDIHAESQIFPLPGKSILSHDFDEVDGPLYDCPHVTFPSGILNFRKTRILS